MNKKYRTQNQAKRAHIVAVAKCQKKTMTSIHIRLHNINDLEVINKLNSVENKTDYIRQLILNDINKNH